MSTVALSDEENSGRVMTPADDSKHTSLVIDDEEKDSSFEHPIPRPVPAPVIRLKKKLLVLDLNGLLVDIVYSPPTYLKADINIGMRGIFRRPFCLDFLKFCLERFEVGIWSSGAKELITRIVDYLMGDMKSKLLFCWDASYCTTAEFGTLENMHETTVYNFKELRKLWEKHDPELPWEEGYFNASNTLLIDDSPYKALLNPDHTAIFPSSFRVRHSNDNVLGERGELRLTLKELAEADSVPDFVAASPFGQEAITRKSATWKFYCQVIGALHPSHGQIISSVCPDQHV